MIEKVILTSGTRGIHFSHLADKIRDYITQNALKKGDKLPSERTLCQMFGCGRNTIRETLKQMESQGMITIEPSKGSFVNGEVFDYSMVMQFVKKNFLEQLEIKSLIEAQIIKYACKLGTSHQCEELIICAKEMIRVSNLGVYPENLDIEFHKMLCKFSPNQVMRQMIESMLDIFSEYWESFFSEYWSKMDSTDYSLNLTIPAHLDLAYAIKAKNEAEALKWYKVIGDLDVYIFNAIRE